MVHSIKILLALGLLAGWGLLAAGCVSVGGKEPLISIQGRQPGPPPVAANIPPGPEHDICRTEMSRALADLADCRRDKDNAKRKYEDKIAKLERERDDAERDRDRWKKNYERLSDSMQR